MLPIIRSSVLFALGPVLALAQPQTYFWEVLAGRNFDIKDGNPAVDSVLESPSGLAFDSEGNLFIVEAFKRIRKVNRNGVIETAFDASKNLASQIWSGLTVDSQGNLYFASRYQIWQVNRNGVANLVAGTGNLGTGGDGGPASQADISGVSGMAIDGQGRILFCDARAGARRFTPGGRMELITAAGQCNAIAVSSSGSILFSDPRRGVLELSPSGALSVRRSGFGADHLAVDRNGNLAVSEGSRISAFDLNGRSTMLVDGNGDPSPDGTQASGASAGNVTGLAFDPAGRLYFSEQSSHRVRFIGSGILRTAAGTTNLGDGGPAIKARLMWAPELAQTPGGPIYFIESPRRIRKIGPDGIVRTVVGGGTLTNWQNGATATSLSLSIASFAVEADGTITFLDYDSGLVRVSPDGRCEKWWSLPSRGGFSSAGGGEFFITQSNRTYLLSRSKTLTLLAGTGQAGFSGDGGAASQALLNGPASVTRNPIDSSIWFRDSGNVAIRRVDSNGTMTSVFKPGDSLPFSLNDVRSLSFDPEGNLYFSSGGKVWRRTPAGHIAEVSSANLYGIVAAASGQILVSIYDQIGRLRPPSVVPNGLVNAASFSPSALSPGSLFSLYLADAKFDPAVMSTLPLPRAFGGLQVRFGQTNAPLLYIGERQINGQIPWTLTPGPVTVTVEGANFLTVPYSATLRNASPGIFQREPGKAVVINQDNSLNGPQTPATPGSVVTVFLTGSGAVSPPVGDGEGAPAGPFSQPSGSVATSINGVPADIVFSGLTPGTAGVMQINARIPDNVPDGELPVVVTIAGIESNRATLVVSSRSPSASSRRKK